MNAFKAGLINSQCCNSHSHGSHSVTGCRSWRCTPTAVQRRAQHLPTRQHACLNRRFTGNTHPTARAGSLPTWPGNLRPRPLTVTSAKQYPTRFASPVAPRPIVLSSSSTGAGLRCVSAIWPFRVWRRVPFH